MKEHPDNDNKNEDVEQLIERGNELLAPPSSPVEAQKKFLQALKIQPVNIDVLLGLGVAAGMQGDHSRAEDFFRSAVGLEPVDWKTNVRLGESLLYQLRYSEAKPYFLTAYKGRPRNWFILNSLGTIATKEQLNEEAEFYYRQALEVAVDHGKKHVATTLFSLGLSVGRQYRHQEAEGFFRRALELDIESQDLRTDILISLGTSLIEQSRHQEAISIYRLETELDKNNFIWYRETGKALLKLDQFNEGIELLQKAGALNSEDAETLYYLGQAYQLLKENASAIEPLRRSIDIDPTVKQVHVKLIQSLKALELWEECLVACENALKLFAGDGRFVIDKSFILSRLDRKNEALVFLEGDIQATNIIDMLKEQGNASPEESEIQFALGRAFHAIDAHEAAIKHFQQSIKADPGVLEVHRDLIHSFSVLGEWEEVLSATREALKLFPNDPFLTAASSYAHINLGQYVEALKYNRKNSDAYEEDLLEQESEKRFDGNFARVRSIYFIGLRWTHYFVYRLARNPLFILSVVGLIASPSLAWVGTLIASLYFASALRRLIYNHLFYNNAKMALSEFLEKRDMIELESVELFGLWEEDFLHTPSTIFKMGLRDAWKIAGAPAKMSTVASVGVPLSVFVASSKDPDFIVCSAISYTNPFGYSFIFLPRYPNEMAPIERFLYFHELEHVNWRGAFQEDFQFTTPLLFAIGCLFLLFLSPGLAWTIYIGAIAVLGTSYLRITQAQHREIIADNIALYRLSSPLEAAAVGITLSDIFNDYMKVDGISFKQKIELSFRRQVMLSTVEAIIKEAPKYTIPWYLNAAPIFVLLLLPAIIVMTMQLAGLERWILYPAVLLGLLADLFGLRKYRQLKKKNRATLQSLLEIYTSELYESLGIEVAETVTRLDDLSPEESRKLMIESIARKVRDDLARNIEMRDKKPR